MPKNLALLIVAVFLLCFIGFFAMKLIGVIVLKFGIVIVLLLAAYLWLMYKTDNKRE